MFTLVSVGGWGSRRDSAPSEDEGKEERGRQGCRKELLIIERLDGTQKVHGRIDMLRMAQ